MKLKKLTIIIVDMLISVKLVEDLLPYLSLNLSEVSAGGADH